MLAEFPFEYLSAKKRPTGKKTPSLPGKQNNTNVVDLHTLGSLQETRDQGRNASDGWYRVCGGWAPRDVGHTGLILAQPRQGKTCLRREQNCPQNVGTCGVLPVTCTKSGTDVGQSRKGSTGR